MFIQVLYREAPVRFVSKRFEARLVSRGSVRPGSNRFRFESVPVRPVRRSILPIKTNIKTCIVDYYGRLHMIMHIGIHIQILSTIPIKNHMPCHMNPHIASKIYQNITILTRNRLI